VLCKCDEVSRSLLIAESSGPEIGLQLPRVKIVRVTGLEAYVTGREKNCWKRKRRWAAVEQLVMRPAQTFATLSGLPGSYYTEQKKSARRRNIEENKKRKKVAQLNNRVATDDPNHQFEWMWFCFLVIGFEWMSVRERRNSRFGVSWSNPEMTEVPCCGRGVGRYNLRHKESLLGRADRARSRLELGRLGDSGRRRYGRAGDWDRLICHGFIGRDLVPVPGLKCGCRQNLKVEVSQLVFETCSWLAG
jgi:hypothetical protein